MILKRKYRKNYDASVWTAESIGNG